MQAEREHDKKEITQLKSEVSKITSKVSKFVNERNLETDNMIIVFGKTTRKTSDMLAHLPFFACCTSHKYADNTIKRIKETNPNLVVLVRTTIKNARSVWNNFKSCHLDHVTRYRNHFTLTDVNAFDFFDTVIRDENGIKNFFREIKRIDISLEPYRFTNGATRWYQQLTPDLNQVECSNFF